MIHRWCFHLVTACLALVISTTAMADDPIWIDVRSAEEFSGSHVERAINIPYDQIAEGISSVTSDKNALIYVYCRSGRRSGIAKNTLEELGYTEVINVGGLDDALVKAGQDTDS